MKLADTLACVDVKRWHTINTTRQQTVAEHQWVVTIIAGEIFNRMGMTMSRTTIWGALVHDAHEVNGGDIPNVEDPESMDLVNRINAMDLNDQIIKIADLMDASWFIENNCQGSRAVKQSYVADRRLQFVINNLTNDNLRNVAIEVYDEL